MQHVPELIDVFVTFRELMSDGYLKSSENVFCFSKSEQRYHFYSSLGNGCTCVQFSRLSAHIALNEADICEWKGETALALVPSRNPRGDQRHQNMSFMEEMFSRMIY